MGDVPQHFAVGDLDVVAVSDGTAKLPPQYFVNSDWSAHQSLLGPDGMLRLPVGCFVVRTSGSTVLVDAGLGPYDLPVFRGGHLPAQLEAAGVQPSDVDVVVCTHLHMDHTGWLVRDGSPFFPNAAVRFGAADWDHFVTGGPPGDLTREALLTLAALDRLAPIDADGETVAPGVTARFAPGHTPGHHCLVLSSGDRRALLLGDAVTCPVQLEEPDWSAISDVDPQLAARTRRALWRELEDAGSPRWRPTSPGCSSAGCWPARGAGTGRDRCRLDIPTARSLEAMHTDSLFVSEEASWPCPRMRSWPGRPRS